MNQTDLSLISPKPVPDTSPQYFQMGQMMHRQRQKDVNFNQAQEDRAIAADRLETAKKIFSTGINEENITKYGQVTGDIKTAQEMLTKYQEHKKNQADYQNLMDTHQKNILDHAKLQDDIVAHATIERGQIFGDVDLNDATPENMNKITNRWNYYRQVNPHLADYDEKNNLIRGAEVQEQPDLNMIAAIKSRALSAQQQETNKQNEIENKIKKEALDETKRHNKVLESINSANININALNEEEQASLANAIKNGFDPYKINSRNAVIISHLDRDTGGKVKWNTAAANAMYERALSTQNTESILNTIDPLLDNLKQKGRELGNTNIPFMNNVINLAKEGTGDPSIIAFNNARDDAVAELERGLLGTGVLSDSKYLRALKNVNSAQSYTQLEAAVEQMKIAIRSRLGAITEQNNRDSGLNPSKNESLKKGEIYSHPNGVMIQRID
jgi:hypothetical protein